MIAITSVVETETERLFCLYYIIIAEKTLMEDLYWVNVMIESEEIWLNK